MSYETNNENEITVQTDNTQLIGTRVPYSIVLEFVDRPQAQYPQAPRIEEGQDVIYISACPDPTVFKPNMQKSIEPSTIDNS